ncbi:Aste57867_2655 [Aphanomyces stellatus]|uniref:Aste57867_2655 protein n=1 Tax=Aphanomyces stellatus TaxID=120398 RepID=A0A485K9P1_9STRA|nr:hypothetical protein As57867_002648 [Aphanomyces stellatus]VFT79849.1 Aste57867_2655 [Aphanomyces stellatus]
MGDANQHPPTPPRSQHSTDDGHNDLLESRRARRRQRSKVNQRKYRAWQRASDNQLKHDVEELTTSTKRLELHLKALHRGERFSVEADSVQEYLRLFARGYDGSARQHTFLRFFLAPNVWCAGENGVDHVISLWDSYNVNFGSVHIDMRHLTGLYTCQDEVAVEALVVARLHVTSVTLTTLFPHLRAQDRTDLVQKLLGQVLHVPLRLLYVFDEAKKVVRIETEANWFAALADHLERVGDISVAMDGARMYQDAHLRPAPLGE